MTCRRNPGSRFPASSGRSPLWHGWEVDAEWTQRTQPVHSDCPRDWTYSWTGALPCPSCSNVAILQETRPQPGAELGRHHRSAAAVWWECGSYGVLFKPREPETVLGFTVTNSCCLDIHYQNVLMQIKHFWDIKWRLTATQGKGFLVNGRWIILWSGGELILAPPLDTQKYLSQFFPQVKSLYHGEKSPDDKCLTVWLHDGLFKDGEIVVKGCSV